MTAHPGAKRFRGVVDGNKMPSIAAIGAAATGGQFPSQTGMDRISGAHTIFVEGSLEVNASTNSLIRSFESGAGNGFGLSVDDVALINNGFFYWRNNGNGVTSTSGALGTNSEQFTHRMAFTNDGTNANFYAKGALNRTIANTNLPTANSARRTTVVGSNNLQGSGSTNLVLVWDRVLSLADYLSLYFNPWQLFQLPARAIFAPPAAGGVTVDCTVGAETEAGLAAAIALSTAFTTSIYTETEAGLSATIVLPTSFTTSVFTETEAGLGATIVLPTSFTTSVFTETEAGLAATITSATNVECAVANENEAGIITTVTVSTQVNCVIANEDEAGLAVSVTNGTTVICTVSDEQEVGLGATITASGASSGITPWYYLAQKRGKR